MYKIPNLRKNALRAIQTISGAASSFRSTKLKTVFDIVEHKSTLPATLWPKRELKCYIPGDARAALSCPKWGIITNGEITRVRGW